MAGNNPQYTASENIKVSRFVTIDGDNSPFHATVKTAGAGDLVVGVIQEGGREAPIPALNPDQLPEDPKEVVAVGAGENARIYGEGETCEVFASAPVPAGSIVKAVAGGEAAVHDTGPSAGIAQNAALAAGDLLRVQILIDQS